MKQPCLRLISALALGILILLFGGLVARAHQPFFEEPDTTVSSPMTVKDPEISTALYATLDRPGDVDFFAFKVSAGQSIEIGMTIPQIEGQEQFAPNIAVIASEFDASALTALPAAAHPLVTEMTGAVLIDPTKGTVFFEPFSRTAYWRRQSRQITFPSAGEVRVVVWHPQTLVGRYTLVIGQREVLGGDINFARRLKEYWTPVVQAIENETRHQPPSIPDSDQDAKEQVQNQSAIVQPTDRCNWLIRLLAALIGAGEQCQ